MILILVLFVLKPERWDGMRRDSQGYQILDATH
jgi:hypothetical protein